MEIIKFLNENSGAITAVFTVVVSLTTMFYAYLTYKLVAETTMMRKVQTEPKIQISLDSIDEALHIQRLRIKNIGLGPALDIKFSAKSAQDDEGAKMLIADFTRSNFLKSGLSYLGPNDKRYSQYTNTSADWEVKAKAVFDFEVSYKSVTGEYYSEVIVIDMSEYADEYRLGTPHLYAIATAINKIERNINRVVGRGKVAVDVHTSADREKERDMFIKMAEEAKKNRNPEKDNN